MNLILKGTADVTRYVVLRNATTGAPETGYTITNLDLQYTRNRTAPVAKVDAVALAATNTAHTDNRAIEVDATSSPGLYRIDWPDAAFASGVDKVLLVVSGAGVDPAYEEIQLVNFNPEDGVRLGLTALPNAAADAAGGLIISDAGGLDADAQRADVAAILVDTGTTLQGELDGIQADTEDIQSKIGTPAVTLAADIADVEGKVDDLETRLGTPSDLGSGATVAGNLVDIEAQTDNLAGIETKIDTIDGIVNAILLDTAEIGAAGAGLTEAGGTGDHLTAINLPNQTMDIVGNITGNLSGSVGSVTGNVGGNVTGSIGALATQAKADVNAEADTAIADAALASAANLALVKAKTDQLTFTETGVVDANLQFINDVEMVGDGDSTPFGPA